MNATVETWQDRQYRIEAERRMGEPMPPAPPDDDLVQRLRKRVADLLDTQRLLQDTVRERGARIALLERQLVQCQEDLSYEQLARERADAERRDMLDKYGAACIEMRRLTALVEQKKQEG